MLLVNRTWWAKWIERSPKIMRRGKRDKILLTTPCHDLSFDLRY